MHNIKVTILASVTLMIFTSDIPVDIWGSSFVHFFLKRNK